MRPAELVGLKQENRHLPDEGWGLLLVSDTRRSAGKAWTDNGQTHDERGLKQRDDTRPVPVPPELVKILKAHIEEFGTAPDGRIFTNERGALVGSSTYYRVWTEARPYAFAPDKVASRHAARPYDLRHGGVSLGLNGTTDPVDVAERAGHSVEILLRVYAKCIDGRREANNKLIEDRLNEGTTTPTNRPHPRTAPLRPVSGSRRATTDLVRPAQTQRPAVLTDSRAVSHLLRERRPTAAQTGSQLHMV